MTQLDFPGGAVDESLLVNAGDVDSVPDPRRSQVLQSN